MAWKGKSEGEEALWEGGECGKAGKVERRGKWEGKEIEEIQEDVEIELDL